MLLLTRHGAPVEGLRPGSLLVAHQASLQGTMFSQSVVLITEKSSRGTKGVMLTQVWWCSKCAGTVNK